MLDRGSRITGRAFLSIGHSEGQGLCDSDHDGSLSHDYDRPGSGVPEGTDHFETRVWNDSGGPIHHLACLPMIEGLIRKREDEKKKG